MSKHPVQMVSFDVPHFLFSHSRGNVREHELPHGVHAGGSPTGNDIGRLRLHQPNPASGTRLGRSLGKYHLENERANRSILALDSGGRLHAGSYLETMHVFRWSNHKFVISLMLDMLLENDVRCYVFKLTRKPYKSRQCMTN